MMQLEELARQATTDAKLAVAELEVPAIGPAAVKQKASASWAKPLFAMAALFLVAGTAWVLLGGNNGVEPTRVAEVDDVPTELVRPLTHPDAVNAEIAAFRSEEEARFVDVEPESFIYGNSESKKGFMVLLSLNLESLSDDDLSKLGDEVRGLPTGVEEVEDGNVVISWIESDTIVGTAISRTMTEQELLIELQNPDLVRSQTANESEYPFVGVSLLTDGTGTVGLDGYFTAFDLPTMDASNKFQVLISEGSLETEVATNEYVFGTEYELQRIRGGKQAFVSVREDGREQWKTVLWQESPGVVAVLTHSLPEVSLDELLEVAEALTETEAPSGDEAEVENPSGSADVSLSLAPLVPVDGVVSVQQLPNLDSAPKTIKTFVYANSDGEPALTVTTAYQLTSFAGRKLIPTDRSIDGNRILAGPYGPGVAAVWGTPEETMVAAVSATLSEDELLRLLSDYPDLRNGNVAPDGPRLVGVSQRFAPDGASTFRLDIEGYDAYVSPPEAEFYSVTTFSGDVAAELAAQRFLLPNSSEREIRGGKASILSVVEEPDDRKQLIWGEQDDVVVVLETTPDVPDEQLYAWAEALVQEDADTDTDEVDDEPASAAAPTVEDRIIEIQAEGSEILVIEDRGILYMTNDGSRQVCVEVVGVTDAETQVYCDDVTDFADGEAVLSAIWIYPKAARPIYEGNLLVLGSSDITELKTFGDFPSTFEIEEARNNDGDTFSYHLQTGYGSEAGEPINGRNVSGERLARTRIVEFTAEADESTEPPEGIGVAMPDDVQAKVQEIEDAGHAIFQLKPYENGGADILYSTKDGEQVCIEVVGLLLDTTCVPIAGDALADGFFFRSLGDDVNSGERSVLIIRRTDLSVTFVSHDEVQNTLLEDGTRIILASTLNPDDAFVEIFDVDGSIIENNPVQEP